MPEETVYQHLKRRGVTRREFMKLSGAVAVALGLQWEAPLEASGLAVTGLKPAPAPAKLVARALASKPRVPVIWLEFQDCAGCSEALTRSQSPTLVNLVLNQITIEYHETLSAAAGFQAEEAKQAAMKQYAGKYVL